MAFCAACRHSALMDAISAPRPRLALALPALRLATDERLVAQVRAGSRGAFETLYDRHHAGLLSFCRHMLGTREEAEDVLQQTFVAAYQSMLADNRQIAFKAWLYTIARNRCVSVLRARREEVRLDDAGDTFAATAGLAAEVEQREDLRAMLVDLQQLPDEQRAALILAELGAHSHEEIAVILGVPTTKIKALVFQAREALSNRRTARDTDCASIREQLADRRGGARKRLLRHHVAQCEGCRAFDVEVRRQGAAMGVLLPVAPTLALKHGALAAAFGGGGSAGGIAVAGGASAMGGASSFFGANAIGAKVLLALAVVGAGGGYVAVKEIPRALSGDSSGQAVSTGKEISAHARSSVAGATAQGRRALCHLGLPCAVPVGTGAAAAPASDNAPGGADPSADSSTAAADTAAGLNVDTPAAGAGNGSNPATANSSASAGTGSTSSSTANTPASTSTGAGSTKPAKPTAPPADSSTPPAGHHPATPATPATPADPNGAGTPATPATAATPATPATGNGAASGGGPAGGPPPQANGNPGGTPK